MVSSRRDSNLRQKDTKSKPYLDLSWLLQIYIYSTAVSNPGEKIFSECQRSFIERTVVDVSEEIHNILILRTLNGKKPSCDCVHTVKKMCKFTYALKIIEERVNRKGNAL